MTDAKSSPWKVAAVATTPMTPVAVLTAAGFTAGSIPTIGISGWLAARRMEGSGGCGVAGDGDRGRPPVEEPSGGLFRHPGDLVQCSHPIRSPILVGEIEQVGEGQLASYLGQTLKPPTPESKTPIIGDISAGRPMARW